MKKLTKDQKYYRKQKKDGLKDFRQTTREDGSKGVRVTRKTINVSISTRAFERLIELSKICELTRWQMLTRIILTQLPRYASLSGSSSPTERYSWDESLLNPSDQKIRYKGTEGERQVTYQITSTAYNKLECHKNAVALSKARIIQSLILNYEPMTKEQLEKQKTYINESRKAHQKKIAGQSLATTGKAPKFIERGGTIIHVKGIPPEGWDDEEFDEFLTMQQSS